MKIPPLIHRGIPLARASEEFGRIIVHVEHEIHDREEFTALVRWGAVVLARTHPATSIAKHACGACGVTAVGDVPGGGTLCYACGAESIPTRFNVAEGDE